MSRRTRLTALAAALAVVALAGSAVAASTGTPSVVTVGAATQLVAGDRAPFDAPGVRAIRAGRPIPAGYVLLGRRVETRRGTNVAGAAMRVFCPGAKRLRTFGVTGAAGFQSTGDYVGRRSAVIVSLPDGRRARTSGTVYAVCR